MNFEHTFFLTDFYVKYLLNSTGFLVDAQTEYGYGHTTVYVAHKDRMDLDNIVSFDGQYLENKQVFEQWIDYYKSRVERINNFLATGSKEVYLFGAHISSQFYKAFGLNMNKIIGLLDNDKKKQGKRVGGIDKEIWSPSVLSGKQAAVIVPESPYAKEIKEGARDRNY